MNEFNIADPFQTVALENYKHTTASKPINTVYVLLFLI